MSRSLRYLYISITYVKCRFINKCVSKMNEKIQTFTILIFSIHNKNYNLGTIILLHILLGTL